MTIKNLTAVPGVLPPPKPPEARSAGAMDRFAATLANAMQERGAAKPNDQYLIAVELTRLQMMRGIFSLDADQGEDRSWSTSFRSFPSLSPLPQTEPQAPPQSRPLRQEVDSLPGPVTLASPPLAAAKPEAIPGPVRVPQGVESIVDRASRRYGVDPALIKAVIKAESSFNQHAVSPVGAQGLMQLMPGTASDLGVKNPLDAEENVMGGTKYLKGLLKKYDGHLDKALAAYNWGPGNVDRRGIETLPRETRDYLVKVKRFYDNYSA
ncbi:MAG: lytic transglycosylase domain-containing protein [Trichloromonadaceae bacterium]